MNGSMAAVSGLDAPRWVNFVKVANLFAPTRPPRHVHLIWSLSLGGAERIVANLACSYSECGTEAEVVLLRDSLVEHQVWAPGITVHRLGALPWPERLAYAAQIIRASGLPAYCHLMFAPDLAPLWDLGCRTVPVVHNASGGWRAAPILFEVPQVPLVVACGDAVARELHAAGLRKPVRVLRHVVAQTTPATLSRRRDIRAAFGVCDDTLLIGMIGRFASQKRYTRAVRILAELRQRGLDVRLVILGAAADRSAALCRHAADMESRALGVRGALVMPGPVAGAAALLPAFDVFLNTSLFEGVSVATMEAVAAGVPVVTADVGGQSEAVGPADVLMDRTASDAAWADRIEAAAARPPSQTPLLDWRSRHGAAHVWPWMLALGPGARAGPRQTDLLFVTGSLDVGGAQRSLCNLAAELASRGRKVTVAVVGPFGVPGFMDGARLAGAEFLDLSEDAGPTHGLHGRAGRVMSLALERSPHAIVFWNMDAATKMLIAKVMAGGPVRLADVSPGPMLYRELDAEAALGRTLSTSPDAYLASLDLLVSKYAGGGPAPGQGQPKAFAIIPNGVLEPDGPLPDGEGPAPPIWANPSLAVVTVGRLSQSKRPDLLPLVAQALALRVPGATLTVVGGVHEGGQDGAWQMVLNACDGVLPGNLLFPGPDHRTTGFLHRFAAFYMVSTDQGCPNASLEAMICGLPVVANPDGGTVEQVEHDVTGLLVPDAADPVVHADALAEALAGLLRNPARARAMGAAGKSRARTTFSMAAMADAYSRALLGAESHGCHVPHHPSSSWLSPEAGTQAHSGTVVTERADPCPDLLGCGPA